MGRGFKLTQLQVDKAKAPGLHGDGAGLSLKVTPGLSKSWVFRYMLVGKAHWMGLGSYPDVGLAEAREKAADLRKLTGKGIDPLSERRKEVSVIRAALAKSITFNEAAEQFISAHRAGWKNAKHVDQWRNTLSTYAGPVIGMLDVSLIETAHVVKILERDDFWTDKTETASRVRGRIESVLDWATVRKFRSGENPARWKGHLDTLLPAPAKVAKVEHHAALPWGEVGAFMLALRNQSGIAALALEFAILTAARSGEVRLAKWDEFDLDSAQWIIPEGRMKAGREHRVPLSTKALALLKAQRDAYPLGYVFPGAKADKPLSDMSLTAVLRRMDRTDCTVHGFRSTFRDWAGEATSHSREVIEHALAHQLKDKAEAAYARSSLMEKRRRLMQDWADFCDLKLTGEVIPLRSPVAA